MTSFSRLHESRISSASADCSQQLCNTMNEILCVRVVVVVVVSVVAMKLSKHSWSNVLGKDLTVP